MNEGVQNPHRQQQLYWAQMIELKAACAYMRLYRNHLSRWVTAIGTIRAVASSGSIAAWALWREHAFVWAAIIAISQVLDAVKDVFPVTKRHKVASDHVNQLESLFIDAQLEWENIFTGHYPDGEIANRRHKLMKLQHEAEAKSFPDGLAERKSDFRVAQAETKLYFEKTYDVQK